MLKTYKVHPGQKPTEEQRQEIKAATARPIVFDEDCPEISEKMISHYKNMKKALNNKEKV